MTAHHDQTVGPRPPFDPELTAALAAMAGFVPASIAPDEIDTWRERFTTLVAPPADEDLRRDGTYDVVERAVPGPPGATDISLLICTPVDPPGPTPVLYSIHGGGMIMGDRRTGLDTLLAQAAEVGAAVVSVEYRLAPEHPHPAPVEDCYAGLMWTAAHAADIGADPDRIVVIGGSAGGGLAAAVTLMARDRGGPALFGQMLMCPMIDDRLDSPSAAQMTGVGVWDRTANLTGWDALLGDARGGPDVSPYAAPARATDLSGLPPTYVDVGSAETFRDEDVAYASGIWRAGGVCQLHVWSGGFHGFAGLAPQAALSQAALAAQTGWLKRLIG